MLKQADSDRGFEYLDDPGLPAEVAAQSLRDIALANKLFGGTRAVLAEARLVFREQQKLGAKTLTLLDIGTGLADIPVSLKAEALAYGIELRAVGLEITLAMARLANKRNVVMMAGDARALPFADGSIDLITCSLVLHHLNEADSIVMLRECARVARVCVIVSDLRRSWLAIVLLWVVSFPLRFHPISRHDGIVSIRRGYTASELRSLIQLACGPRVQCRNRLGWRIAAAWTPTLQSSSGLPTPPSLHS